MGAPALQFDDEDEDDVDSQPGLGVSGDIQRPGDREVNSAYERSLQGDDQSRAQFWRQNSGPKRDTDGKLVPPPPPDHSEYSPRDNNGNLVPPPPPGKYSPRDNNGNLVPPPPPNHSAYSPRDNNGNLVPPPPPDKKDDDPGNKPVNPYSDAAVKKHASEAGKMFGAGNKKGAAFAGKAGKAAAIGNAAGKVAQGDLKGIQELGEGVATEFTKQAAGEAVRAAMIASGVGAVASDAAARVTKWLTEKVLPVLLAAQKKILKALKKYLLVTTVVNLCVIFLIISAGAGYAQKAAKGIGGKTSPSPASAFDSTDINNINTTLGAEIMGDKKKWYFSQVDKGDKNGNGGWNDDSYGCGKTIGSSGCGCTSVAMVLKKYGAQVDPTTTCAFCLSNGFRPCGSGTAPGCFAAIAKKYGLKADTVQGWDAAKKLLEQGKPLIISVHGSNFTSGSGHYIVLAGIQGDTVIINDPGPRNKDSATVSQVLNGFKHGYYYIHN